MAANNVYFLALPILKLSQAHFAVRRNHRPVRSLTKNPAPCVRRGRTLGTIDTKSPRASTARLFRSCLNPAPNAEKLGLNLRLLYRRHLKNYLKNGRHHTPVSRFILEATNSPPGLVSPSDAGRSPVYHPVLVGPNSPRLPQTREPNRPPTVIRAGRLPFLLNQLRK